MKQYITSIKLGPSGRDTQHIEGVWYGDSPTPGPFHRYAQVSTIVLSIASGMRFFVVDSRTGAEAEVVVVSAAPPHIRTTPDRTVRDNLLSLPTT